MAPNHWRLQAQILFGHLQLATQSLTGALLNFFQLSSFVTKPSSLYGQPVFRKKQKKRTQFHLHVTVTLCNIHHRPFLPSILNVHRSWFLFFLFFFSTCFCVIVADCSKRLWNFKNLTLPPFSKLGFPPGRRSPWKLLGKLDAKRKRAAVERVHAANCTEEWHWVHNDAHFLSARHSHTQQRLNPQRGSDRFWVSGTIPNKRGFS